MATKPFNFWPSLLVLALLQFTHILDFVILMPLGPQLMHEMGLTTSQFGMTVSVYTLSAAIAGVIGAFYLDHFDRKKTLLMSYLGFGIGTIFCGLSHGYWGLMMARAITGAFGGICGATVLAIVGDIVPLNKRGMAMGVLMSSFSLASILGVPIGLAVAYRWGWHLPFLGLGTICVIIGAIIYAVVPPLVDHLTQPITTSRWTELCTVLSEPAHLKAYGFSVLLVFSGFTIVPFLSPFMVSNMGFPEHKLALLYLTGGLATLCSMTLIGRMADRFGKRLVYTIMALLSLVPIVLITGSGITPFWQCVALSGLFMVCMSGRMIPAMAIITTVPSAEHRGGFMSIHSSIQQLAMSGAALLGGLLISQGLDGKILHYNRVGVLACGSLALSLLVVRQFRRQEAS